MIGYTGIGIVIGFLSVGLGFGVVKLIHWINGIGESLSALRIRVDSLEKRVDSSLRGGEGVKKSVIQGEK